MVDDLYEMVVLEVTDVFIYAKDVDGAGVGGTCRT